jgi:hypothetical protein
MVQVRVPVYPCGDTVPGLNEQHKQAMQSIAYEKENGDLNGSQTGKPFLTPFQNNTEKAFVIIFVHGKRL